MLIIVCESTLRNILCKIFMFRGYKIAPCSTGFNGLRNFRKGIGKFDIVIIDSLLPDISGLKVAKIIRSQKKNLPLFLIKKPGQNLESRELKEEHIHTFFKPLCMDTLLKLAENAVKKNGS